MIIESGFLGKINNNGCEFHVNGIKAENGTETTVGDNLALVALPLVTISSATIGNFANGVYNRKGFNVNDSGSEATATNDGSVFTGEDTSNIGTNYIDIVTTELSGFSITQGFLDQVSANSCTFEVDGAQAASGQAVAPTSLLSFVADSGYAILSASFNFYSGGLSETKTFTVAEGGAKANATYDDSKIDFSSTDDITSLNLEVEQSTSDTLGNNKVYILTEDQVKQLSKERFVTFEGVEKAVDYATFILGLIQIPSKIPDEFVGGSELVELGDQQTSISAVGVSVDEITFDFGEIVVPAPDSFLGFERVSCLLHLPYTSPINLDSRYVLGATLKVEYVTSLYDGKAYINVFSSNFGTDVFSSKNTTLGVEVPYISERVLADVSNDSVEIGGDNKIEMPILEISKPAYNDASEFFSASAQRSGILTNEKGYVEVENISLDFDCLADEKDDIKSILSQGVIIK